MRRLARFVLGLLFREVQLVGAEHLPSDGPVVVIANHSNSLVDGGILLGFLPRIPRFLAASTVWDYKPVAPFMNASGSVRVYRQQDGRAHEGSLEDSFSEAAGLLADGGVLAIFPEGRTHDDPTLLPFKTGAARIVRFTEDRHGPLDLAVVPVGLDYEGKNLFRSRVCFTFGRPVSLAAGDGPGPRAGAAPDQRGPKTAETVAVRAATGGLQRALSAVAPDFANVEEAGSVTLAAEIRALEPGGRRGRAPAYDTIVAERNAVRAALGRADADAAPEAAAARAALEAYAVALADAGLADHELAAPPGRAALARSLLALLPGLPVALVALLFCLPQAIVLRNVSRRHPRDRQMSWITFGGLVVYPLTWVVWAVVLGLIAGSAFGAVWGWVAAVAALAAAPVSARLALPTIDRAMRVARMVRARRRLRGDPDLAPRLAGLRGRAEAAVDRLFAACAGDGAA